MAITDGDFKAIMLVFIGGIVAIVILASVADTIFPQTNTLAVINTTVTGAAVNTTLDLQGRELLTTQEIHNSTNATDNLFDEGASLQTGTGTNGLLTVQLILNDTAAAYVGRPIDVSYTFNPDGYISNSGGRSINNLIPIFAALAILVFVIVMFIKFGSMGTLIRSK